MRKWSCFVFMKKVFLKIYLSIFCNANSVKMYLYMVNSRGKLLGVWLFLWEKRLQILRKHNDCRDSSISHIKNSPERLPIWSSGNFSILNEQEKNWSNVFGYPLTKLYYLQTFFFQKKNFLLRLPFDCYHRVVVEQKQIVWKFCVGLDSSVSFVRHKIATKTFKCRLLSVLNFFHSQFIV